jgi:23S rRNA (cytidine1920-2'-O)/16S rRNA (cytidine1409-2'-O)-methyltransferase
VAARLVMAGRVRLGGRRVDKAGRLVAADAALELVAPAPYVGRGGDKLAAALRTLGVDPDGRVCLDVGASTGGFTDCLLQHGARRVHAVDVGRGQMHPRLRGDPRVTLREGANARNLDPSWFDEPPSLAVIDVAFISLEKVLPAVGRCLVPEATKPGSPEIVALVKPQFEVGKGQVGKGGVVRDATLHRAVLERLAQTATGLWLHVAGMAASPLLGPMGNREFLLHIRSGRTGADVPAMIAEATGSAAA